MGTFRMEHREVLQSHLASGRRLYEACLDEQGGLRWQRVDGQDIQAFQVPALRGETPKRYFFAERELLYRFDGGIFYSALPDTAAEVLFGVLSGDLQAIAYQDLIFADDQRYQSRKQATLLVGFLCRDSCEHSRGYTVLVTSTAGNLAPQGLSLDQGDVDWPVCSEASVARQQAGRENIASGIAALSAGLVGQETWKVVALGIPGIDACASVCPTYFCFSLEDEAGSTGQSSNRERVWDSCPSRDFQLEASGRNPSSAGRQEKHFWSHKFSNDFKARLRRYGCVGCDRSSGPEWHGAGAQQVLRWISRL